MMVLLAIAWSRSATAAGNTPAPAFDAQAAAASTNSAVQTYAGDPAKIKDNLAQPLMSGGQLTAFNGTKFNGKLGCQSSNTFLTMMIQPGGTGDITTTTIMQDLNMDGVVDNVYNLPVPVSGVCANGVISCAPGTWNNCQPYSWTATAIGALSLTATTINNLGGCYCINSHCGANLAMNNLGKVLGDMGGGAAAAMGAANPLYAISNVDVSGPSISYYGQDTSRCGQTGGNPGIVAYAANPNAMGTDAASNTSTNSVYQLLSNSPAAQQTASPMGITGFVQSCQVTATAHVNETPKLCGQDGSYTVNTYFPTGELSSYAYAICQGGQLLLDVATVGNFYWSTPGPGCEDVSTYGQTGGYFNATTATGWADGSFICAGYRGECQGRLTQINSQTFLLERMGNIVLIDDGAGNITYGDTCPPGMYCTPQTNVCGEYGPYSGTAFQSANLFVPLTPNCDPANVTTTINDICAPYENNPKCALMTETVDGVSTYQNYNPTGLAPLPSTQMATGNYCAFPVTRNWWSMSRQYLCHEAGTYTFDDDMKRIATIKSSATPTGYNDYRLDTKTNSWSAVNNNPLTLPTVPPAPTCTQVCKTRMSRVASDSNEAGVALDARTSGTTYDFYYHDCGQSNVCPTQAGEEILKTCQCINDFSEVTAIMQAMRLAGRDLICTDGTSSPLQ